MENNLVKKKILLVTAWNFGHKDPCQRALVKLGYEVDFFNSRPGLYFRSRIVRKIYRTIPGAKNLLKNKINKMFLDKVRADKPDYIFSLKAELISPEAIKEAGAMGTITINWYSEYMWQWDINLKLAPAYDFFFSSDSYVLRKLKEAGLNNCFFLAQAFDLKENWPDPFENRKEEYDVAMVASYSNSFYANRTAAMDAIKDLGLNIWGSKGWSDSPLKDCYRGKADENETLEIYRKAKIVPNIHYNKELSDAVSPRPFEAMGAGAMAVSDDVRSDIFRIFKDGEDFVSFHDGDTAQLRRIVEYYLSHPDERLAIARNGYKKVITNHTFLARMKEMMEIVGRQAN